MSKLSQALLTKTRSKKALKYMTPWQKRRQERLEKLLRFKDTPNTITGKILVCIQNEKTCDVGNIIDYCRARFGVTITPQQIYGAVYSLRQQGLVKPYVHTYQAK